MRLDHSRNGQSYRIADLKHCSCRCCFIPAHDVLDHDITSLLFGSEDRSANDGGVLMFREILQSPIKGQTTTMTCRVDRIIYLSGIANFEKPGTSIEDCRWTE